MIKKIAGLFLVILALSTMFYSSTVGAEAKDSIESKVQYELNDGITDSTRIDLFNVNTSEDNTLVIFLPFEIKELQGNNSSYYTSIGRIDNWSIIQIYINKKDKGQNNITLKYSINVDNVTDSGNVLKVLSYPLGTSVTVPRINAEEVSKYNDTLRNITNPTVITEFKEVDVVFDNNYEVINPGKKVDKVSKNDIRMMALNSTYNQYEILFRNVQSETKGFILSILKALIINIVGFASIFIALGYIPNKKFKIIIITYAIIALILMVGSLFFMSSKTELFMNIPGYIVNIGSFFVWWSCIRNMRNQTPTT